MTVSVVYRQLDAWEEATEIDYHDREMPWTAFSEPSGMSSWRVVEGDCVASELRFKNDQIFIQIGITPSVKEKHVFCRRRDRCEILRSRIAVVNDGGSRKAYDVQLLLLPYSLKA